MSLSCECGDYCPEPGDTYIQDVSDYKPMSVLGRRKRCCNCKQIIKPCTLACEVFRVKVPENDIEVAIYGEDGEIPMGSWYLCESCADIYFSLEELGFCVPVDNLAESLREYQDNYIKQKAS